jgi:hypothetical protein
VGLAESTFVIQLGGLRLRGFSGQIVRPWRTVEGQGQETRRRRGNRQAKEDWRDEKHYFKIQLEA